MAGIQVDTVTAQSLYTVTVEAADAHEKFRRCVRSDGARCGAGDRAIGICRIASTMAGDLLPVDVHGIAQGEAGAAIALVDGVRPVKPDADGRLVPVGDLDPDPATGLALAAASAAGDYVPVLLLDADPRQALMLEHDDNNQIHQRFVTGAGHRCGANQQMIGAGLSMSAASGEQIRVQAGGIALVVAGGAIALAQGSVRVKSDAQGRAITPVGSNPSGGLALDAAAQAGVVVRVLLARD